MSGKWSNTSIPPEPGVFINFETTGTVGVAPGPFGVVGVPFTAAWGPINEFTLMSNPNELEYTYGVDNGDGSVTSWVVRDIFEGGAGQVLGLRIADGTEAKASKILQNTTPAAALTLTAKYHGTRGNAFGVTTRTNPLDSNLRDLLILEGGGVRETYTYAPTDITDLAAQINDTRNGSELVVASGVTSGVALGTVTNSLFTGGLDGATTIAADYIEAQEAFERNGGFDVFTLDGIDNSGINTSLVAWTRGQNDVGNYVFSVVGGPAAETVSTAITRAQGYNNEFVASLGGQDFLVTLPDGTEVARTSAEIAPRIAGAIAAAGISGSITRVVLPGVRLSNPLTGSELANAIGGGLVPIVRRGDQVIVADGVTTFTGVSDIKDATFSAISSVRAMQEIGVTCDRILETEFLGKKRNTPTVQRAIRNRLLGYLQQLEAMDVLVNGSDVELDTRFNNTGYSIFLLISVTFTSELKRVLITVRAPGVS